MMFRAALCLSLASLASVCLGQQEPPACGASPDNPSCRQDFDGCAVSDYYASLPADRNQWTRQDLEALVTSTHRFNLPLDGVYEAMIEIDAHPEGGVALIYSQQNDLNIDEYNRQEAWSREHLWPDTRGVSGQAFNDIYNSRPETTRITSIRGDLLYGECGTVEYGDVCVSPAFGAAPQDTAEDGKIWQPPAAVRGDIARALFYMELRYKNTDSNLTLSDCPPWQGTSKMGYLSQLLEWDDDDPVSQEEIERNNNACQFWQGNRNPFVDDPNLAKRLFRAPEEIPLGERVYPSCVDIPTPSPTADANDCGLLDPGDVFIYAMESDDADGVGFLALEAIPEGLTLYLTDYPWNGERFIAQQGEGVYKHVVPASGYAAGDDFGFGPDYGPEQQWSRHEGNFNIGVEGDSVMLYCELGDGSINPLVAFTFAEGGWMEAGLDASEYGASGSALPEQLSEVGNVALPHFDNYAYEGERDAQTKENLQAAMMLPENWKGQDANVGDSAGISVLQSIAFEFTFVLMAIAVGAYEVF